MNRRNFAIRFAAGSALVTVGHLLAPLAAAAVESAPGWSSASAVRLLQGHRFRIDGSPGTALRLVDVIEYRNDDRQFTARFEADGNAPAEGIHRLRAAGHTVDLFLQPVHDDPAVVEAVICHACA